MWIDLNRPPHRLEQCQKINQLKLATSCDRHKVTSSVLMFTKIKEAESNSVVGNKHTAREGEREIKASNRASEHGRFCGVIEDVAPAAHEDTIEPASTRGLKLG